MSKSIVVTSQKYCLSTISIKKRAQGNPCAHLTRKNLVSWQNSQFFAPLNSLRAIVHEQLTVDITGVSFDCAEGNVQLVGDLLVGQALRDQS